MKPRHKLICIAVIVLLLGWFFYKCAGATPLLPPLPPSVHNVLQSPKGSEQSASLEKVPVKAAAVAKPSPLVIADKLLKWTWPTNGVFIPDTNIVFILRSTTDLTTHPKNWTVFAVTATNRYPFSPSGDLRFFRCWASNTVSGLVSQ